MTRLPKTICNRCRYPMIELESFDGVSSQDAPGFEKKDTHDYFWFGLWAFVPGMLGGMWRFMGRAGRKRKVKKLQEELLPNYPNSIVCPHCLLTIERP